MCSGEGSSRCNLLLYRTNKEERLLPKKRGTKAIRVWTGTYGSLVLSNNNKSDVTVMFNKSKS